MRASGFDTHELAGSAVPAQPDGFLRRYRAIILGGILVPLNILLLLYMEIGTKSVTGHGAGPYPSTVSLFANTILFLVVLTVLNAAFARRHATLALERGELIVIYVMLTISTAIVSIDFLDVLLPMMTHPHRFATPENRWADIIMPHIPSWISVSDPEALKGWYEGNDTIYRWSNLRPWIVPVSVWSAVVLTMLWVMFCINTIVRQQWMQNEKLLFPIVEVPMQITEPGHRLLKSRLMWLGFGIAGGISVLNGLNILYPTLPYIPVKMMDISPYMPGRPWNAMGWTPISFYPYAIGLSFLLPVDMLFSCWFFFVMWRVVRVVGAIYGAYDTTPNFPFMDQQALGAYYLVAVFALWSGRRHLRRVYDVAFNGLEDPGEADGPMRYRTAFLGLAIGTFAVSWFFTLIGLAWWMAITAVGLYFFIALAIAKMHAEFGPPAHDLHRMGPEMVLTGMLGPRAFTPGELAGFSWFWWFNRAYRSIPIAYQLDGLKLGQRTGTPQRYMGIAIAVASVIAVIGGFWIYLHLGYQKGLSVGMAGHAQWFGVEAFAQRLQTWIENPNKPDVFGTIAIGWGMVFTYILYFMKLRASWWPFHPLGFAISTSYSICTLWLPMFIAWGAKILALRFGGLRMFRVLLDLFLGLLLGDFLIGCLWPVVGWIFGIPTYSFMQ